jgi:hypothetical protein
MAATMAGWGSPFTGGRGGDDAGDAATEAVSTDMCAEATMGNLPPGT